VTPAVLPQLVANDGTRAMRAAIPDPERHACEPKVDGVRGLLVIDGDTMAMHNGRGQRRDCVRGDAFETGLRRLARRLPIVTEGTVLDGELTTGRFATTMSALLGSKRHRADLRFVAFDVPVLAGVDLLGMPWAELRDAWPPSSGVRGPVRAVAHRRPVDRARRRHAGWQARGGIVLKDRTSTYRDGSRDGWTKVKDRSWFEREAWRFDRR